MSVTELSRLSEGARREVEQLLRDGKKIAAIKRVRHELQIDLKSAKEAVEAHMSALGIQSTGSGCLLLIAVLGAGALLAAAIV